MYYSVGKFPRNLKPQSHNYIYFMRRKINASDGTMGTDDDDFMGRNQQDRERFSFKLHLSGADPGEVKWVNFHPPFF